MALINPQIPVAIVAAQDVADNYIGRTASSHCNDGDFVSLVVTPGVVSTIAPAGANPTQVAGIIQHDSSSVTAQIDTTQQGVFGATQTLNSRQAALCQVVTLGDTPVAINLTPTTGYVTGGTQQAAVGTRVGLAVDPTTGFYLADPTATNKIATVTEKVAGPNALNSNPGSPLGTPFGPSFGDVGDLGARVLIVFDITALNPVTGH